MWKLAIWAWSYLCWLAVCRVPLCWRWNALLPWAGLYGYTEGGWTEFRDHATVTGFEICWDATR